MTHDEIVTELYNLGFNEGWAVRDGKIVVWENETAIPENLSDYLEIDANEPTED